MGNLWILTVKKQHESEKLLSWEARENPFSVGSAKVQYPGLALVLRDVPQHGQRGRY